MAHDSENDKMYHFRARKNLREPLLGTLVLEMKKLEMKKQAEREEVAHLRSYSLFVAVESGTRSSDSQSRALPSPEVDKTKCHHNC